MSARTLFVIFLGLLLAGLMVQPAFADGIIIPSPIPPCPRNGGICPPPPPHFHPISQLDIRYHHVDVNIDDQVAVTHIDQVFHNSNPWPVEGTYVFPLPTDAVVSSFTLWIDGKPVQGKVLDANQARQTYEDIVRNLRDPALLEYIGRGAVQANIFPIQPGEDRRIELEYRQVLTAESGLVRYIYPLNTEKFSDKPLDNVRINVKVAAKQTIRAVYSPSHAVDVTHLGDTGFQASYEASNVSPDADFALYYSLGSTEAFHLLSYRDPGDEQNPDGFFTLLLAPKPQAQSEVIGKDVIMVLDRSGSMEGDKFQQAQEALRYILRHLNPADRFYVSAFSSGFDSYAPTLKSVDDVEPALKWVDQLDAAGSTDINRALLEAASIADKERPTYLIFLTDGLPTQGETDSQKILNNFAVGAPKNVRLFTFGLGYDVDTFLLDSLSQDHHGLSTYVKPGEALDEILSQFYAKISTPVLTNLTLNFDGVSTYDVYPNPLPDLFSGNQVVVVGRYKKGGSANATLTGEVNGQIQSFHFYQQQFATDSRATADPSTSLPRLWATRKIGSLLNKIRLSGPDQETIDQIVKLSIRYGIVTPYTSYLVTEPMPLGAVNQHRVAQDQFNQMQAAPAAPSSGASAVQKAADEGSMAQADQAPAPAAPEAGQDQTIRSVGSRTFVLSNGIWTDTAYDPDKLKTQQISFLSKEYFELAQSRPDAAAAMALGDRVIIMIDGSAYEVVAEGASSTPAAMPSAITPVPLGGTPVAEAAATRPVENTNPTPQPTSIPIAGASQNSKPALPCAGSLILVLAAAWVTWRRSQS